MTKTIKLFIPGPVEVSQKTFAAMTQPMIGHRSPDLKRFIGLSTRASTTLSNPATGVFIDLFGLGRHGRCDPKSGQEGRTQLHVRSLFRQMVRRFEAMR